jgi:hypothetical protein
MDITGEVDDVAAAYDRICVDNRMCMDRFI